MKIISDANEYINIDRFYCEVAEEGYHWFEGVLYENPGSYKKFDPLELSAMNEKKKDRLEPAFKAFVGLSETPNDFINFANKYGRIWPLSDEARSSIRYDQPILFPDRDFQSLDFWIERYKELKLAHDIFTGNIKTITGKVILSREPTDSTAFLKEPTWHPGHEDILGWLDSSKDVEEAIEALQETNHCFLLVTPSKCPEYFKLPIFHHEIKNCKKPTEVTVLKIFLAKFIAKNMKKIGCEYTLSYDASKDRWYPLIQPETLLGMLWYQLAEELAGNRKYKKCKYCGKYQDVTENKENWNAHPDCANSERVKNWRKKHKEEELNGGTRNIKRARK